MRTSAIIFEEPGRLSVGETELYDPCQDDVVVETIWTGVSSGTERLLWEGRMPQFPGLGYPLVPGYEAVGRVVETNDNGSHHVGDMVFVPGSSSYKDVKGLFGGSASHLVVHHEKAVKVDEALGQDATLLALAATAYRGVTKHSDLLPELIVGHGVLGRLAAKIVLAIGGEAPVIWETNPVRQESTEGFNVIDPSIDGQASYACALDVSGNSDIINLLVPHLSAQGRITLAGFYTAEMKFAFPPAFMREASFAISAEWKPSDLQAVLNLIATEKLSLSGLITHQQSSDQAQSAYETAFSDDRCLKMILDWKAQ